MFRFFPHLPFYTRYGAIPESYLIALSYEEQLLWLCKTITDVDNKVGGGFDDLKDYIDNALEQIDESLMQKQNLLTAGENIIIDDNGVISAIYGENLTSQISMDYTYGQYNVGETMPRVLVQFDDTACIEITEGENPVDYKIKGTFDIYEIDSVTREILSKDSQDYRNSFYDFTTTGGRHLVICWWTSNSSPALIKLYDPTQDILDLQNDVSDLQTAVTGKQDTLTAGSGITIENNVISVAGSSGMQMNKLESDLTFVNGVSPSGYFFEAFYYTDNYEIKYNNGDTTDTIFGTNEVVYWNPDTLTWVGSEKCMIYNEQSDTWSVIFNQEIDRINLELLNKQNTLTAGTGISIVNNVISATGGGGSEESYAVNGSNPNVFTLSTTSNYEKIPMEIIEQIGNLFSTNSQGYIVANQDIDMALITFKAPLESANNTSVRYIRIAINDVVKAISFSTMNSNTKLNITIPNLLVTDIKQGDIITFEFYGYSGDKISNHNGQFTITSVLPSNPASNLNVTNLTQDIILGAGSSTTSLSTGFYNTNGYGVYYHSATIGNLIYGNGIFYYDNTELTFIDSYNITSYSVGDSDWVITNNASVESTLTNSTIHVPNSYAVSQALAPQIGCFSFTQGSDVDINVTSAWTYYKLPIAYEVNNIGNSFSFNSSSNEITIGENVSKIKVDMICYHFSRNATTEISVYKNGTRLAPAIADKQSSDTTPSTPASNQIFVCSTQSIIIDVQENDVITFGLRGSATGHYYLKDLSSFTLTKIM